jgi:hypothetical protein
MAVAGKPPPSAEPTKWTGELTVAPLAGDETETVWARPMVDNNKSPIKGLIMFFKLNS